MDMKVILDMFSDIEALATQMKQKPHENLAERIENVRVKAHVQWKLLKEEIEKANE